MCIISTKVRAQGHVISASMCFFKEKNNKKRQLSNTRFLDLVYRCVMFFGYFTSVIYELTYA